MHGLFLGVSCGDGGGFDVFFWGLGLGCVLSVALLGTLSVLTGLSSKRSSYVRTWKSP